MPKTLKIALAGNPNSGKTTLFNRLTGAHQHVGNYPGVTVETKRGVVNHSGESIELIDLPGTYSLTALSPEELTARNIIISEKPDVVIDIVDSSTLERQLYLTVQLLELEIPLVIALNMADLAEKSGLRFDLPLLSKLLGVPIVETIGSRGEGIDTLLDTAIKVARSEIPLNHRAFSYGRVLDNAIQEIAGKLKEPGREQSLLDGVPSRWLAIKLLESDQEVESQLENSGVLTSDAKSALEQAHSRLSLTYSDPPDILVAEARYGIISGAASESVKRTVEVRHDFSDRLDSFLINPILGIPIFLALMFAVFNLTFRVGGPLTSLLAGGFGALGSAISSWWPDASSPLRSLVVDGLISGVGGVISFVPNILLLFLAIAFLEDSGYMARAAFIMDRAMHTIGLHGKSFIPMLIGFGCSVPAILGTRILENRRDRLVTILVIPLMSCSARLPIYSLIIPAFFPTAWQGPMLWTIYILGMLLAIGFTKLLRSTVFRGESTPFIMELPPYRVPTAQGLWIHAWERGMGYLRKAGTIILSISIILWWATAYPRAGVVPVMPNYQQTISMENRAAVEQIETSYAGQFSKAIEPALKPMGFDWRIGTALLGAVAAKEVFVAQLGIVFSMGQNSEGTNTLGKRLRENYTPLVGFCVMLFMLIGMPCLATVAAAKSETGSWGWALFQWGGLTAVAWILTTIVYQAGTALRLGI